MKKIFALFVISAFSVIRKELTMKKSSILLYKCLIVFILTTDSASADLILDISDAGDGNTRWVFSGSGATVTSSFRWSHNGYYGEDWANGSPNNASGVFPILSGSGSFFVNGSSYLFHDVNLAIEGGIRAVSPRYSPGPVKRFGDFLTWSGDIITSAPISYFSYSGTFSTTQLFGGVTLDSPLVINVSGVPEPSALILLGLGLTGLGFRRRPSLESNV